MHLLLRCCCDCCAACCCCAAACATASAAAAEAAATAACCCWCCSKAVPLKSNSWVGVGGPSPPVDTLAHWRLLLPMEVMTLMPLTVPRPGMLQLLLLLLTTELLLLPIAFVAGEETPTPIPTPPLSPTDFRPNGALQV